VPLDELLLLRTSIETTFPATSSPDAALTVTVACCPTLTSLMSDSLSETSKCMRLSWVRTMKDELLDEALLVDEPLPPAPPVPPPDADDDAEDDAEDEDDDEPPLLT
jgi:hypothetical protein